MGRRLREIGEEGKFGRVIRTEAAHPEEIDPQGGSMGLAKARLEGRVPWSFETPLRLRSAAPQDERVS
jgi:hypothetical protein